LKKALLLNAKVDLRKNDIDRTSKFTTSELIEAQSKIQPIFKNLQTMLKKALADPSKKRLSFYVGISYESNARTDVKSGKEELKRAEQIGFRNDTCQVFSVTEELLSCYAFTLEQKLIKYFKARNPNRLLNRSVCFGTGKLPNDWTPNTSYTLTILEGTSISHSIDAYKLPNDLESLDEVIANGKKSGKAVCQFADALYSTENPHDTEKDGVYEKTLQHPSQRSIHREMTDQEFDCDYTELVNNCQIHTCGHYCLKSKNKCRYHFNTPRVKIENNPVKNYHHS